MSEDCHESCGDKPTPDSGDGALFRYPIVEDKTITHPVRDVSVPATIDVRDILDAYLIANAFDGLFNEDADCACQVGDLAPCGEGFMHCMAGHRKPCDCGDHDWHIVSRDDA